jgi:hypothetical protein
MMSLKAVVVRIPARLEGIDGKADRSDLSLDLHLRCRRLCPARAR